MDSAVAGLIGAIVGACVVIVNTLITNRSQLRLEKQKSKLARQENLYTELRNQIVEVAHHMLSAQHSIEWVCWHGKQGAFAVNAQLISEFHKEIHNTYPKLLGALAVVASLDIRVYEELASLAENIYEIEGRMAEAFVSHEHSPEMLSKVLAEYYPNALDLYKSLPFALARIMKSSKEQNAITNRKL